MRSLLAITLLAASSAPARQPAAKNGTLVVDAPWASAAYVGLSAIESPAAGASVAPGRYVVTATRQDGRAAAAQVTVRADELKTVAIAPPKPKMKARKPPRWASRPPKDCAVGSSRVWSPTAGASHALLAGAVALLSQSGQGGGDEHLGVVDGVARFEIRKSTYAAGGSWTLTCPVGEANRLRLTATAGSDVRAGSRTGKTLRASAVLAAIAKATADLVTAHRGIAVVSRAERSSNENDDGILVETRTGTTQSGVVDTHVTRGSLDLHIQRAIRMMDAEITLHAHGGARTHQHHFEETIRLRFNPVGASAVHELVLRDGVLVDAPANLDTAAVDAALRRSLKALGIRVRSAKARPAVGGAPTADATLEWSLDPEGAPD